ncbi:MAG: heavy-metal-associated domain-containing protein [Deltaproteobacteria bacterium]|nr:heavy-metal-associated domain-containing protein [Deltaproteobacteria bacterium]
MSKAVFSFTGGHCSSCSYAIERNGRKIKGVEEVYVDSANGIIHLDYNGDEDVLEKFQEITFILGHGSELVSGDSEEK